MPAQDDAREQQMLLMFNLTVPPGRTRGGLDALLELDDGSDPVPFELKSTTKTSISTVRDLSAAHVAKWKSLHWLFAFYEKDGTTLRHCYYASPADMAPWIVERERYIRPDLVLVERLPLLVTHSDLVQVLGDRPAYSSEDAKSVMKRQWSAQQYTDNADLPDGRYSPERMIELLRERCAYVLRRGSTLNNPHIPGRYLSSRLEPITRNHAAALRRLVNDYRSKREQTLAAGEVPAEDAVEPTAVQDSAVDTEDAKE